MKVNKNLALFIIIFSFLLCSCKGKSTPEYISYINESDGAVYLYMDDKIDGYNLSNISTVSKISDVSFDHEYTLLVIDAANYSSYLTSENVSQIYDYLSSDKKFMVIFWKAENYNFFKDTPFSNEKDYYGNTALLNVYDNFDSKISNVFQDINVDDLFACTSTFSDRIKGYRGSL